MGKRISLTKVFVLCVLASAASGFVGVLIILLNISRNLEFPVIMLMLAVIPTLSFLVCYNAVILPKFSLIEQKPPDCVKKPDVLSGIIYSIMLAFFFMGC